MWLSPSSFAITGPDILSWRAVGWVLFLWVTLYANMVLHEAGHVWVNHWLGGQSACINWGGQPSLRWGKLQVGPWAFKGWVQYELVPAGSYARALVCLGGPLANLLAASVGGLLGLAGVGETPWLAVWVGLSLLVGLGNLLPLPNFDGACALRHFRIGRRLRHATAKARTQHEMCKLAQSGVSCTGEFQAIDATVQSVLFAIASMSQLHLFDQAALSFVDWESLSNSIWTPARRPLLPQDKTLLPATHQWLNSLPRGVRPLKLQKQYARIANILRAIGNDNVKASAYLDELLSDTRGGRDGFAPIIDEELRVLRTFLRVDKR